MRHFWVRCLLGIALCVSGYAQAIHTKPLEIMVWHSLAGQLGTELQAVVQAFNQRQQEYVVTLQYKGDYTESLTSFAAAFRAKQAPALIQVFEVGTGTMLGSGGVITPLGSLMTEQNMALPTTDFFHVLQDSYGDKHQMMAMPLNTSIPLLFYNADALDKVGYSARSFPKTWLEFDQLAKKLKQAGFSCVYTTAYPSWILIESYLAIHGLPMMDATTHQAIYNHPQMIQFLERLRHWQQRHYFEYGGRVDDATMLFTSGRCPILSQSSGSYRGLQAIVPFHIGLAALPLDTEVSAKRHPNVVGGAALWAVSGQTDAMYHGIAAFFSYLAEPKVQARWYEQTGYLPLGVVGRYGALGHAKAHSILGLAQSEWTQHEKTVSVVHSGAQHHIRIINDEALEMIFSGMKSPKAAMDEAVLRANQAQHHFVLNTAP